MPTALQRYSYRYGNPFEGPSETRLGTMDYKRNMTSQFGGRRPKKYVRAGVAKRYPVVKLIKNAPSRQYNFRPLNFLPAPPVVGKTHRCKMLYRSSTLLSATGIDVVDGQVYSANAVFDPDITGTGHKPIGSDQLFLLYEHYTVLGGKITCDFTNTDAKENCYVGISIAPDSTVTTPANKLIENGMLKRGWLSNNSAPNAAMHCQLTLPFDIAKINGVHRSIIGDELYRGDAASNPTEQTYLHVFNYNPYTTGASTVHLEVVIEYDVVWTEPRKLATS